MANIIKSLSTSLVVPVFILLCFPAPGGLSRELRAGNWAQFRGPTGQGLAASRGLPLRWGPKKNVAWKRKIPGKGWSSPILHAGALYLTTAVPLGEGDAGPQELRALALDPLTGATLWSVEVFRQEAQQIHDKNSHASPTPIGDGESVYVHFGTNGTARLDLEGNVLWRNEKIAYDPRHGSGGSPALFGGALFISCDGYDRQFVLALDAANGKELWRRARPPHSGNGFSFSTPLIIEVGGKPQVVMPGSEHVISYEPRDGAEIWRFRYPGGYSVVPRPLFAHGLVYVCSGFNQPSLFAIRPDGRGDVTATHLAWKVSAGVPHTPGPVIVGEDLFFISDKGIVSCLDARTGERHWRERLGGNHSSAPVVAEGRIYFQSEQGEGIVIEASARDLKVLSRNPLEERTLASYALTDGAIFIRTAEHLYRIAEVAAPAPR